MVREDGKRNFALRDQDGREESVFSGRTLRQAALKAARWVDPSSSKECTREQTTEIRLREKGTDKIHIYDAWAWEEAAPADAPNWMPEQIIEANVSKQDLCHMDE